MVELSVRYWRKSVFNLFAVGRGLSDMQSVGDTYRSKVDWWIAVLLCIPPLAGLLVCVKALVNGGVSDLVVGGGVMLFVVLLYAGCLIPLRYELNDEFLIVRSGLIRMKYRLSEITSVEPTRNPLSSPAMSLDRLRARTGSGLMNGVMISPADKDGFLDRLAELTGLVRNGDSLMPKDSGQSCD